MISDEVLVNWMKLTRVKGIGPRRIMNLLNIFGAVENVFSATSYELLKSRAFTEESLEQWRNLEGASPGSFLKVIQQCRERNIYILPLFSEGYPGCLKQIPSPPLTLFLSGNLGLLNTPKIAVVGTRKPSPDAKSWAFELSRNLAEKKITIVSGGALGIDAEAHAGALDCLEGNTVCVLGSGLSNSYPKENLPLFERIKKRGLLVSEHLPDFPGSAIALIQRNRITSGLSKGLVLVASDERGGSMIQAKFAFEQRVPIFCPPIALNLAPNKGLHQAVKLYRAKEVNSADEIICELEKIEVVGVQAKLSSD